ncbi:Hypothetical protein CINCED_3A025246 [Cinara cedri]|uniref:Uncharacterized protein n=1 Tax=Cinara cedri TaxID=506608 RepID=A0A5E4NQZ9_9HEMI|nr:Hypothetical protein CINCED_3A025246 [Cinara cedri]
MRILSEKNGDIVVWSQYGAHYIRSTIKEMFFGINLTQSIETDWCPRKNGKLLPER